MNEYKKIKSPLWSIIAPMKNSNEWNQENVSIETRIHIRRMKLLKSLSLEDANIRDRKNKKKEQLCLGLKIASRYFRHIY